LSPHRSLMEAAQRDDKLVTSINSLFSQKYQDIPIYPPTGSSPKDALDFYVKKCRKFRFFFLPLCTNK
jgi:hypothetical protein